MYRRFFSVLVATVILFSVAFVNAVQASEGDEGGGNAQSPGQVVVQIVVTAIALKVMQHFDLP